MTAHASNAFHRPHAGPARGFVRMDSTGSYQHGPRRTRDLRGGHEGRWRGQHTIVQAPVSINCLCQRSSWTLHQLVADPDQVGGGAYVAPAP